MYPYSRWEWSESPCNQSGRKGKGREDSLEEPSLEFRMNSRLGSSANPFLHEVDSPSYHAWRFNFIVTALAFSYSFSGVTKVGVDTVTDTCLTLFTSKVMTFLVIDLQTTITILLSRQERIQDREGGGGQRGHAPLPKYAEVAFWSTALWLIHWLWNSSDQPSCLKCTNVQYRFGGRAPPGPAGGVNYPRPPQPQSSGTYF